ncbi:MAG: glycoside hydrolase [Opitutaceae bacterium]|jgi:hypothetical protein|nr:glycoside hydrolase [Opitutaceae bacterium]
MKSKIQSVLPITFALCVASASAAVLPPPPGTHDSGPVPGIIIDSSPDFATTYVGSPSIARLADGTLVASHDWFGKSPLNHLTVILTSTDNGKSWRKQAEFPFFWGNLFVHNNTLYLLGMARPYPAKSTANEAPFSHLAIRKSTDAGKTWTTPDSPKTGLLRTDAIYHTAPCPVVIHKGRVWRAIETIMSPEETLKHTSITGFGRNFQARVVSASVDADLLDAASWTLSDPFLFDYANWPVGTGFLEGNVVVAPDGRLVNILRCQSTGLEKAILLDVSDDGKCLSSRGPASQITFPGGAVKFTIRFDPVSKRYWTLSTQQKSPLANRNYLVLMASDDLVHWEQRAALLRHHDWKYHAFQYVDWIFDGDDILYVSRTAWDNAHNAHDANHMTLHRAQNFRSLTTDAPWLGKNTIRQIETPNLIINGTFAATGILKNGAKAFTNRPYTWLNVPEALDGWHYILTPGGVQDTLCVVPKTDTTLHIIAPTSAKPAGWKPTGQILNYSDPNKAKAAILSREVPKDQRLEIPQPGFIGGILIWKE